jgi:hypothetical protein
MASFIPPSSKADLPDYSILVTAADYSIIVDYRAYVIKENQR